MVTDIHKRNPEFIPIFTILQNYYNQAMTSFTNTEKNSSNTNFILKLSSETNELIQNDDSSGSF